VPTEEPLMTGTCGGGGSGGRYPVLHAAHAQTLSATDTRTIQNTKMRPTSNASFCGKSGRRSNDAGCRTHHREEKFITTFPSVLGACAMQLVPTDSQHRVSLKCGLPTTCTFKLLPAAESA